MPIGRGVSCALFLGQSLAFHDFGNGPGKGWATCRIDLTIYKGAIWQRFRQVSRRPHAILGHRQRRAVKGSGQSLLYAVRLQSIEIFSAT